MKKKILSLWASARSWHPKRSRNQRRSWRATSLKRTWRPLNATKVQLEKDIKTRDKQLEELKKASGSSEEPRNRLRTCRQRIRLPKRNMRRI